MAAIEGAIEGIKKALEEKKSEQKPGT
jgi:DNA-binding FrmR family transcriptional regulator